MVAMRRRRKINNTPVIRHSVRDRLEAFKAGIMNRVRRRRRLECDVTAEIALLLHDWKVGVMTSS